MTTPLCILLVDDSKFFLELEKHFLRYTPAALLTASSGEIALALTREHLPSLVYMDIDMPDMSGLDCCRIIKADQDLRQIPIILIGAADSSVGAPEAQAVGAEAYLRKPLNRAQFLGAGHRFLASVDRREARQTCDLPVNFVCRGRHLQGRCIDISSGGMFLLCHPTAQIGEKMLLKFPLPDALKTSVEVHGCIAWVNSREEAIKEGFPLGYGVEFVDIAGSTGVAFRRCFGT